MSAACTRFYREVSVEAADGQNGYRVLLDGKPVKTPLGALLLLPTRALAEALAEEWRRQGATLRPETMVLTKLANTAIDRVAHDRKVMIAQILGFARSDLVCYRAEFPAELVARQSASWDPLLTWAVSVYGANLRRGNGIAFVAQTDEALSSLERALSKHSHFALAALHTAAHVSGSAIVALALAAGRLDPESAFAVSHLDEIYQAERWGSDAEAEVRRQTVKKELFEIHRYFSLLQV